jgi:ATP-dependent RNA helicase RhlE
MTFKDLQLIEPVLRALINEGYSVPTPIQEKAIPVLLKGEDVLGCAATGTGKTAAFSIPVIQKLYNKSISIKESKVNSSFPGKKQINALILTPTRELASQIGDSFSAYGKFTTLKHTVIYGGVSQKSQTEALKRGVDILIATPGRLLDLINQGYINLRNIEFFILDEADRMLDMGFINDIKRVVKLIPEKRQTLLFSATMPAEIAELAETLLQNPVRIDIVPEAATVDLIDQHLYYADKANKTSLLIDILNNDNVDSALVFSRTKHGADKLSRNLFKAGIGCDAIHGNKSQNARQKSLLNFKRKKTKVLIATDIASRGIDISQISHVINYDLPEDAETYIHRIGRTGRAGQSGKAISFCDSGELGLLKSIQKLIGRDINVIKGHEFECQVCVQKVERIKISTAPSKAKKVIEKVNENLTGSYRKDDNSRFKTKGRDKKRRGDFWHKGRKKSA